MAQIVLAQVNVLTQHNDNSRTGWNKQEKILHTKNVKATVSGPGFGLAFTRDVDDQIYAQPLVAQVNMPTIGIRNVVYVATVNNTVYAFDADSSALGNPYWSVNLNNGGVTMNNTNTACGYYEDFSGNLGLVSTPVIDLSSQTIYVVRKSIYGGIVKQYLHALDLITGNEKANSPKEITAQVNGTGAGNSGGIITFDPRLQNQRAGLLLLNGVVYIAWASHGDCGNYHGWIMGYDASTLEQKYVYCTTPQGWAGGIWMSAAGLSADENGNIYAAVGNGDVGVTSANDLINKGESMIRLTPNGSSLSLTSFFTPNNYVTLNNNDADFGVTGMLLLPGRKQAFSGAKDGNIYLANRDTLGGYNSTTDKVAQTFNSNNNNISSLTYYKGSTHEYVYIWAVNDVLKALPYDSVQKKFNLSHVVSGTSIGGQGYNGTFTSVSSNGKIDSTAILWASHAANGCNANQNICSGILRAFQANDITKELWNSSQVAADNPGNYAKFNCPTVANGKVYLATFSHKLAVYGLINRKITGIENGESTILVYPNPAKDILHIKVENEIIESVSILDMNGRSLMNESGNLSSEINLKINLSNGVYIIHIQTGHGLVRQKLLINK